MTNPLTEAISALAAKPGDHRHSIRKTSSKGKLDLGFCPGCRRNFYRDQRRRWLPVKDATREVVMKKGDRVITPAGRRGYIVWTKKTASDKRCSVEFSDGTKQGFFASALRHDTER